MVLTKELNDWILDEELINPLTLLVATDGNLGKQLLASREKERGRIVGVNFCHRQRPR